MTGADELRLDADLLGVMRASVTGAVEHGGAFVAPAHLVLGLLADPRIGPVVAPLVSHERVEAAAAAARHTPPAVAELPEGELPGGAQPPFARYDTVAFRSSDGEHTVYLDAAAFHLYLEGARRAAGAYRAKHLVYAFAAEAIKERALLELFAAEPQAVTAAVDALG
ncbi:MAG TPA: hypothetical protein VHT05_14725 [Candidatus Elarobacter sp.]|nr:hypothetical protein [Candidatus Elarobacter sp.]